MKETIEVFLQQKHIAVAGVSRSKGKWGNALMKELMKKDINVYPINPNTDEIEGIKCYRDLKSLPGEVKSLIIATKPGASLELVKSCREAGIERIWMQKGAGKGSASDESIAFCKDHNLPYVYGICPMMYFGGGMHAFHLWIRKVTGKMPVELVG